MKSILRLCFLLLVFPSTASLAQGNFFDRTDALLQKHVEDGRVDYQGLLTKKTELNQLTEIIRTYSYAEADGATQKAFLINAYNVLVLQAITDAWPIASPQDVGGFFDAKKFVVAGRKVSLNGLEKEWLFKDFFDPRLHFVLICGAKGCPPIADFAFQPSILSAQLTARSQKAMNDKRFLRYSSADQAVALSQIFSWYAKDFGGNIAAVLQYINQYRMQPLPASATISYDEYDWSLNGLQKGTRQPTKEAGQALANIQAYTPSVLLKEKEIRIQLFNNLYTQTGFRNGEREFVDLGRKETFFTGIIRFDYGVSAQSRLNIGFEANINGVRYDGESGSSPLRIFGGANNALAQRWELGTIGPRIRWQPFASVPKFSLTSTFLFNVRNDLERNENFGFLTHNRKTWWTQFFYDKIWGDFQFFGEIDLLYRFETKNHSFDQSAFFRTPVTVFLSYFPDTKSTVNVNIQYSPAFTGLPGNDAGISFNLNRSFTQAGLGAKYQITPSLNLEVLYTNFIFSRGEGAGQTFNFGVVFQQ
ncbi:MAG: DUF547 domain-containing protein [Bacteroidota bacterium]